MKNAKRFGLLTILMLLSYSCSFVVKDIRTFAKEAQSTKPCDVIFDVEYDENDPYLEELDKYLASLNAENNPHTIVVKNENVKALCYIGNVLIKYPELRINLDLSELRISTIPEECFYFNDGIQNIQEITLPKTTKIIGQVAFYNLPNLQKVNLNNGLEEIGKWAFESCTSLKTVEIPESVRLIDKSAFRLCKGLEEVKLNEGLQELGPYTFLGCISLKSIELPSTTKKIGKSIFYNCINLEKLVFNEGLTEIPNYCLCAWGTEETTGTNDRSENNKLTSVVIPSTVKRIGYQAFRKCIALKDVTLNEGLEIMDGVSFNICAIEEIVLPSTITTLVQGEGITYPCEPISNCENLKSISFASENPYFMVKEDGCLYTKDGKTLITYPSGLENKEFTVSENVNLAQRVFYNKPNLEKLIIEQGEEDITIGYECFTSSKKIKEIYIPSNVVEIGGDLIKWTNSNVKVYMADTSSSWKKLKLNSETETIEENDFTEVEPFSEDPVENRVRFSEVNYNWQKIK